MASTRKLTVEIAGDVKGVRSAFNQADSAADGFSRKMRRVATAIGGAFAVREVIEFGGALIDAAEESQKVTRQTEAVIKSMGNAANTTADQVADLSTELSLKAGIDDELIQSGANVLLTFKNIRNEVGKGNDIFDQATDITLDLSVALKKDMNSAAILVGKALNDPIKGLTALSRAGVQFTAQQQEQIKAMVAVGDTAGAQKMILAELQSQFEGSAEAQATASGKLAVAWDNAKERLGTALQPAVEKVSLWLAENLPGAIDKTMASLEALKGWVDRNETAVKLLATAVGVGLVTAMLAWAASAASAAVATIAATWPVLVLIGAVAALTLGTQYLINKFNLLPKASRAFQWVIDHAISPLISALQRAVDLARELHEALSLPGMKSFATGGGSGSGAADFLAGQQGARAMGGPVTPGSWLVGEKGPEILTIGSSGYVTPNHQIGQASSGPTIILQGGTFLGTDQRQLKRELIALLGKGAGQGITA